MGGSRPLYAIHIGDCHTWPSNRRVIMAERMASQSSLIEAIPVGSPSGKTEVGTQVETPRVVLPQAVPVTRGELGHQAERGGPTQPIQVQAARRSGFLKPGLLGSALAVIFRAVFVHQPSWVTSALVHSLILVVLGLWSLKIPLSDLLVVTVRQSDESGEDLEQWNHIDVDVEPGDLDISDTLVQDAMKVDVVVDDLGAGAEAAASSQPAPSDKDREPSAGQKPLVNHAPGRFIEGLGTGLGGRADRRSSAVARGATQQSEDAVDRALAWLASHQFQDGGWRFDHLRSSSGKRCRCSHPGNAIRARNAATAMALLPFLGAGQTHQQGAYRKVVADGLKFLIRRQGRGGSLHEPRGNMYAHGLASLALCEAVAMLKVVSPSETPATNALVDPEALAAAAQGSIDFIEDAQHVGGGWRYIPRREPGDTSVVGWQMMALRSGQMAGLKVDRYTILRAEGFLDSVASGDYGEFYGYTSPGRRPATTAIGLLCRMYLGWGPDRPAIQNGVEYLTILGPHRTNMYYNYYATQVMRHYGGPQWDRWNQDMRDFLVAKQIKDRRQSKRREPGESRKRNKNAKRVKGGSQHMVGSWYFDDFYGGGPGGRLYSTALAAMTLEVYYRNMPIYGEVAVDEREDDRVTHYGE